jgi:hypothetical protein
MEDRLYMIDGVLWRRNASSIVPYLPYCPNDRLELKCLGDRDMSKSLVCDECDSRFILPRSYISQSRFVKNKLNAENLKKLKVVDFDDAAVPIAESKDKSDEEYFVTAKLFSTDKVGKRLVVYAGVKGSQEKSQIFLEPEIKRLAFDQADLHPSEIFTKIEATFKDGTKHKIERDET